MKKIILLILFGSMAAHADLLDQLNLEQTLQSRLQNTIKMFDESAKVVVKLEFDTYHGFLPGTNSADGSKISPERIELTDIKKMNVDVYSVLEALPAGAEEAIFKAIPISNKKDVKINFSKVDSNTIRLPKTIEVKDLFEITEQLTKSLALLFCGILAAGIFFTFLISNSISKKRTTELREQIKLLTNAVVENGTGGGASLPVLNNSSQSSAPAYTPPVGATDSSPLEAFALPALKELFADCYWCEEDGYANWLWRQTSSLQKKELLGALPFMKDYSLSFVAQEPKALSFHEHPYYMDATSLEKISQKDLEGLVQKDIGLWHHISPIRKQRLSLSIDQKLKALQSKPSASTGLNLKSPSPLRSLSESPSWGELSLADEVAIYNSPQMVPNHFKPHVRSLVWLAQREPEIIRNTLEKVDARSLAVAWVGPDEILKVLESQLPEKKLKLLLSYKGKSNPTRNNDVYQFLVDEGLKSEAA